MLAHVDPRADGVGARERGSAPSAYGLIPEVFWTEEACQHLGVATSGGDKAHLFQHQEHLMRTVIDFDVLCIKPDFGRFGNIVGV